LIFAAIGGIICRVVRLICPTLQKKSKPTHKTFYSMTRVHKSLPSTVEIFGSSTMNSTAHVDEEVRGRVMTVDLHGTLAREDYQRFIPETEKLIRRYGRFRVLLTMHDFRGWDLGALWEDLMWNARHFHQIERLAIVREHAVERYPAGAVDPRRRREAPPWRQRVAGLMKPLTDAQVRYFTVDQLDVAYAWINEFQGWDPVTPVFPFIP
jgi:hypothetical protein